MTFAPTWSQIKNLLRTSGRIDGLLLDSSELIHSERLELSVDLVLERLRGKYGNVAVVQAAISVIEFEHGVYRAKTAAQAKKRRAYLDDILLGVPVEPLTREIASLVARIDAESRKRGVVIPFADLLIGGTALHLGHRVVTKNERHFRMIPGLQLDAGD